MTQRTGTYDTGSTLQALASATGLVGVDFDAIDIAERVRKDLDTYDAIVSAQLADLAETTEDDIRPGTYGLNGDMMEVGQYSRGPTQKDLPAQFLGFPLRKYQFAVGWTTQYLRITPVGQLVDRVNYAKQRDAVRMRYEIQKAVFTPTNYNYADRFVNPQKVLPVKALTNADSWNLPIGPNGEVFDGTTHTHYDGSATLTVAAVNAAIQDIVEHRNGAKIRIYINAADATTFSALTPGFFALQPGYIADQTIATAAGVALAPRLLTNYVDNRQIGYFGAAEVWTKPWVPPFYMVTIDVAAPQKPLVRRVEKNTRGLFVAAELNTHPLNAEYIENFYGFGAWNRTAAHVLKFNNATYSAPVLSF